MNSSWRTLETDHCISTGKFWHKRELNKHVKAVHKAKDKDKAKARESPEALD